MKTPPDLHRHIDALATAGDSAHRSVLVCGEHHEPHEYTRSHLDGDNLIIIEHKVGSTTDATSLHPKRIRWVHLGETFLSPIDGRGGALRVCRI